MTVKSEAWSHASMAAPRAHSRFPDFSTAAKFRAAVATFIGPLYFDFCEEKTVAGQKLAPIGHARRHLRRPGRAFSQVHNLRHDFLSTQNLSNGNHIVDN